MKPLLFALLFALVQITTASELRLDSVSMPLYLHGSDTDPRISIQQVPYVTYGADPEWRFPAIASPFRPPAGDPKKTQDVNLASVYGIKVEGNYKEGANDMDMVVTIDASKAAQPEGYPFTVEQVIEAVRTCVNLMYPPRPADEGALEIMVKVPQKKAAPPKKPKK